MFVVLCTIIVCLCLEEILKIIYTETYTDFLCMEQAQ